MLFFTFFIPPTLTVCFFFTFFIQPFKLLCLFSTLIWLDFLFSFQFSVIPSVFHSYLSLLFLRFFPLPITSSFLKCYPLPPPFHPPSIPLPPTLGPLSLSLFSKVAVVIQGSSELFIPLFKILAKRKVLSVQRTGTIYELCHEFLLSL